ncbi:MAG: PmoA family protein [Verrucomicrobiota bacterium]
MKISQWIWMLCLSLVATQRGAADGGVTVKQNEEGFAISEEGRPVLFYQIKAKSQEEKFKRANYVHPLYSLGGEVLTEDFPKDHLHHRGVFWAWHTLTVGGEYAGDNWVCDDFEWDLQEAKVVKGKANVGGVETRWLWKSPKVVDAKGEMKAMVEEITTVRVGTRRDHYRLVDFEIRLKALLDEVRMAGSLDEKGYGGFSVRMHRPKDMVFTGDIGVVKPQRLAVEGGEWMDMSGSLTSEGKSGLTILCHPSLPIFPQKWLLRMGAQQNPRWPGNKPVLLPKGEEVILRYRLVIHDDQLKAEDISRLQDEYANEAVK